MPFGWADGGPIFAHHAKHLIDFRGQKFLFFFFNFRSHLLGIVDLGGANKTSRNVNFNVGAR